MKNLFILLLAYLIGTNSHAQYSFTNENSQNVGKTVNKIACDANGNLVFTGSFDSNISFGSFTLTTTNGSSAFIAKKLANGTYSWAKAIFLSSIPGDVSSVAIYGVSIDASGNAYVTGSFRGKISFDNINLSSLKNGSYYTGDMFTAKISSTGSFQWAKSAGTNLNISHSGSWEQGYSVTTDNGGNVYSVGRLSDKLFLNTGTCDWIYPPNPSPNSISSCIYVVKYNSSGTKKWEKKYIDSQADGSICQYPLRGQDVDSDGNNIYVYGIITGSVNFGNATLIAGAMPNVCLFKLDANGNTIWARSVANAHNTYDLADGDPMYFDKNTNNIYIGGRFSHIDGGTLSFGGLNLSSPSYAGYNAKFSSSGTCLWATLTGGHSIGVTRHPNGNIVMLHKQHSHLAYLDTFSIKEIAPVDGSTVNLTTAMIDFSVTWFRHAGIVSVPNGFIFCQYLTGSYDLAGITISSSAGPERDIILVKYTEPLQYALQLLPDKLISNQNPASDQFTIRNGHDDIKSRANDFILYPNPSGSKITLRNTSNKVLGDVVIYDVTGRTTYQNVVSTHETTIDVTDLVNGIYYLSAEGNAKLKFIKK